MRGLNASCIVICASSSNLSGASMYSRTLMNFCHTGRNISGKVVFTLSLFSMMRRIASYILRTTGFPHFASIVVGWAITGTLINAAMRIEAAFLNGQTSES